MTLNLDSELTYKTSRSSGKGGQNVNKVSSKVELDFNVLNSCILTVEQKQIIFKNLSHRITKTGILQMVSQSERSQLSNKEIAKKKIYSLIAAALRPKKKRQATKPSKSSKEKRLKSKKKESQKKKFRRKDFRD